MDGGDVVVRGSVWLAVVCYPAGPAGRLGAPRLLRAVWTIGCLGFLVHVASAFHVHHGWSHAAALRETARQTAELTGRAVGAGLYVNYLFAVLWSLDAAWWWRNPASHRRRPGWVEVGLHVFLLFVVFNGAVVFARGPVRWLGVAVTLIAVATLVLTHAVRGEDPLAR
jgi:hypothetical protein